MCPVTFVEVPGESLCEVQEAAKEESTPAPAEADDIDMDY